MGYSKSDMKYKKLSECAVYSSLRTTNITEATYVSTENMLPNKGGVGLSETIPDAKSASKYEVDDILLSNIRPYFKKIWHASYGGSCSNDVLVIKAINGYAPKFLYYVLSDNNFFNYATVTAKGTKMPRGSKDAIMKYLVPDVEVDVQQRIASILSVYDDLIENNNRRIQILEQMAENLYKEWFVRFRFPGHEQAEFENGIPKGWEVKHIGDICKIITGKKDANEATGDGDFPFFTCARETNVYTNEYFLDANAIIISGNGSYTGFVKKYAGKFDLYQRTYALYDFQNIGWLYVYWFMKIGFEREFMGGSRGSAIPYITKPNIEKYKILIPAKKELKLAEAFFASIHNECLYLEKTNRNLTRQRDMLLPRLMSGKLEV